VRVGKLELQTEPFTHRCDGHAVGRVLRLLDRQLGEHGAGSLEPGREPVGREVRHLVVVAGNPHGRRLERVQAGDRRHVGVRDRVDAGHVASGGQG